MIKKDFSQNNPINRFITSPTEFADNQEQIEGQQSIQDEEYRKIRSADKSSNKEDPKSKEVKKGRPKSDKETKKRISLFMLPSLYESIGKVAYMNKISIGEQISHCLEKFIEENEEKIKKYDELM